MKFESFFSSSKHNLYTVTADNGKRLLIECGCTWKQLLRAINHDLSNIVGCCVTHSHNDHCHCIEKVLENEIDVYTSAGTLEALEIEHRNAHALESLKGRNIADEFRAFPFPVMHDAVDPFGFIVQADGESLLFITDTSHIKARFALEFNILAICCSYDGEILAKLESDDNINTELAKRLITSHMEKEVTKSYIRDFCNLDRCTEIWLLHMSLGNIDQEKTRAEIEKEFMITTYIAGRRR